MKAAQAQGVGDDREARQHHRQAGDDRVEQADRGERDRGDVVPERPGEVLLDRAQRGAAEADRVGRRAQVAGDEREVRGLDRHVGARPDRQPEVGLRERGRVVDAVADHRDDAALGLQPPDDRRLVGGEHLGDHLVDADLGGHRAGGGLVVAGQQHRPQPERLERRDRLGGRVLDRVGDDEHGGRLPVPAGRDRGLAARFGGRARGVELAAGDAAPTRPAAPGARRSRRGLRRCLRRRAPRGWRSSRRRAARRPPPRRSPARSGARTRARAHRRAAAPRCGRRRRQPRSRPGSCGRS